MRRPGQSPRLAQVEQQRRRGSSRPRSRRARDGSLGDRDPHELDRLVVLELLLALLDALGEEQVHQLAAEAGRRPERRTRAATRRRAGPSPRRARAARVASGSSPSSSVPAGSSSSSLRARLAQLAHEDDRCPRRRRRRSRPRPGCSTISRSCSPHRSSVTSIELAVVHECATRRASSREPLHERALLRPEPRRRAGGRVRARMRRIARRRDRDVHPFVRQHPLQQRLRPRLDAELAQRLRARAREGTRLSKRPSPNGRMTITAMPSSAASGSSSRSLSRSCGLYGSCTVSNRPVRIAVGELRERAGRVVRHAESVRRGRRRAPRSSHSRCSRHATRLCTCSISTRPPNHSSCARTARGPPRRSPPRSSSRRTHVGATPSSAAPSERSAPPYIGDESTSRTPLVERGRDDVARERRVASERPPCAEADHGPEPPLLHHADEASRKTARGKRRREEIRILVRPAPHVRERKALRTLRASAQARALPERAAPRGRREARPACDARDRGDAPAHRLSTRSAPAPVGRRARRPRRPPVPPRGRRVPARFPCRRCPARWRRRSHRRRQQPRKRAPSRRSPPARRRRCTAPQQP